nr:BAG family molecular chaperone regulator 4-like [Tanacetum cinerariifolium]
DLENVDKIEEVNKEVEVKETVKEVAGLDVVVCSGTQVADKDIVFLTEMLMRQLLKLDGINAEGEGRTQRQSEVFDDS